MEKKYPRTYFYSSVAIEKALDELPPRKRSAFIRAAVTDLLNRADLKTAEIDQLLKGKAGSGSGDRDAPGRFYADDVRDPEVHVELPVKSKFKYGEEAPPPGVGRPIDGRVVASHDTDPSAKDSRSLRVKVPGLFSKKQVKKKEGD